MLNTIITWIVKTAYGKQLLGLIDGLNERLTGSRTEIVIAIIAVVALLGHTKVLDHHTAQEIVRLLLGALPLTLAEKVGNVLDETDKILPPPSSGSAAQK